MSSAQSPARATERRSYRESTSNESPAGSVETTDSPPSSHTIFSNDHTVSEIHEPASQPQEDIVARRIAQEVKECWVCRGDSTEDTPETSPWRDPCPCALVAHEECLLDWIASKENSRTDRPARLECPQCKGEIRLARPRDYLVDAVRGLESMATSLVTPGALTVLFATVYNSSMVWGIHSVFTVFGERDGLRILQPLLSSSVRPPIEVWVGHGHNEAGRRLVAVWLHHLAHWRLYVGLPLITPALILSRTNIADNILPVLPILFFATQTPARDLQERITWPPSASMAFAVLPYVRAAYNMAYRNLFADKTREWLRRIQPRAGETEGEGNNEPNQVPAPRFEEGLVEVRIDVDGNIWEDGEDDEQVQQPAAAQPRGDIPGNNQPAAAQDEQGEAARAEAAPAPAPGMAAQGAGVAPAQPNAPARAQGERRLSFSPSILAQNILGALLLPTVAGLSGEFLKLVLPRAWTNPSLAAASKHGLLHEKWGRSIVGGCLFVVCKDAIMLYVRWRMAQIHRQRRVVDVDRSKTRPLVAS